MVLLLSALDLLLFDSKIATNISCLRHASSIVRSRCVEIVDDLGVIVLCANLMRIAPGV